MDGNSNSNNNETITVEQQSESEPEDHVVDEQPTRQTNSSQACENAQPSRTRMSTGCRVRKLINCTNSQEKLAKGCCTCGIVCIAAGGGLILVYIMGVYTQFFGDLSNLSALSIPGFCFFFAGLIATVFGVIFCWGCPHRRTNGRPRVSDRDANEAGFGLPGYSDANGYFNQGLVLDPPPSYNDILSCSSSSNTNLPARGGALRMEEISTHSGCGSSQQNPPAYVEAVKVKWTTSFKRKSEEEDMSIQVETDDIAPPAYDAHSAQGSEHDC